MQVAINVLIFCLGLFLPVIVASKQGSRWKDIQNLPSRLRHAMSFSSRPWNLDDQRSQEAGEQRSEEVPETLLTKEQVEAQYDMDSWQRLAYEDFKTTILAKGSGMKTFPCVYATMGYRDGDHRYLFLHSDDPSEPRNIRVVAPALRAYLRMSPSLGPNTSMVIMAAPTEGTLKPVAEYNDGFWEMLRGLRIWDRKPWPAEVPQETDDEKWTYCFDGAPLFPVALTPAHQKRWSRHASVPLIALQPKWVLDQLLSTPEKRKSATGKVRKLLAQYDQVGVSPDLTQYGEAGSSEVHQLCLQDENETVFCPFDDFDKGSKPPSVRSQSSSRRSSMESDRI